MTKLDFFLVKLKMFCTVFVEGVKVVVDGTLITD